MTSCCHECDELYVVKISFKFSLNWTQSLKIPWSTSDSTHSSEFTPDLISPFPKLSVFVLSFVSLHRLLSHYKQVKHWDIWGWLSETCLLPSSSSSSSSSHSDCSCAVFGDALNPSEIILVIDVLLNEIFEMFDCFWFLLLQKKKKCKKKFAQKICKSNANKKRLVVIRSAW